MQEISINLPIIFQILFLTEEFYLEDKTRLNIENNNVFVKMIKLAILFTGVVKYYCHVVLGSDEIFTENTEISC